MKRTQTGSTTTKVGQTLTRPTTTSYPLQDSSTNSAEPPDTQLAAGPKSLLEGVNQTLALYDKAGNSIVSIPTDTFFPAPAGAPADWQTTDPRVVYDGQAGRFVVSMAGYGGIDADQNISSGSVYLAVSPNAVPTSFSGWSIFTVEYWNGGGFCDQPRLGLSSTEVIVTCDFFNYISTTNPTSSNFFAELTDVFSRAEVESATPPSCTAGSCNLHKTDWVDGDVYALVPAVAQNPTSTGFAAYNDADAQFMEQNQGAPKLAIVSYTGDPAIAPVTRSTAYLNASATSPPPLAAQPGTGPVFTITGLELPCGNSAGGGNPCIDTGDDRVTSATWSNGVLWVSANDGCEPTPNFLRSCLRMWQATTSSGIHKSQEFDIGAAGSDLYYGAPALDGGGDMVVSFSVSGTDENPSGTALDQLAGQGALDASTLVEAGQSAYFGSRWGDYSAAAVDPADNGTVWVTSEYALSGGGWGTATAPLNAGNTARSPNIAWDGGHDAVGATAAAPDAYFAEGYTGQNFQEFLTIANPNASSEDVTIHYLLGSGVQTTRSVTVAAQTRATENVNADVGPNQQVSAWLHSDNGTFVAERPMYFNYSGWTGGHDAVGATRLHNLYYFAEGCTCAGFHEYLTLGNPNSSDANVDISYFLDDGTTKIVNKTIPATSRVTVNVNDSTEGVGPGHAVSLTVASHSPNSVPFIAERPMYFAYRGWTGGDDVVGATALSSTIDLAEGAVSPTFDEYLTVLNQDASQTAQLTITYECQNGNTSFYCTHPQTMTVGPHSRGTHQVNQDFPGESVAQSVHITSVVQGTATPLPVLVERPMYFDYLGKWTGGHDAIGVDDSTLSSSYYFAEGHVASNFDEYLTVLNDNAYSVDVTITYFVQGAPSFSKPWSIPAHSRGTYLVNQDFPNQVASMSVSLSAVQGSDGPSQGTPANVLAERPMYFSF